MRSPGGKEVGRISIRVVPDTDDFRRKLRDDLKKIEESVKADIEVNPDTKGFRERVKAATSGIKAEVDVDVKRGALGRISDALSKIQAPSLGSGVNPAGYAVILAGITAVAAPLLGLVTTALLTLPGLIAAVATPIAAVMLGIEGFATAAESLAEPFAQLKETIAIATADAFTPVFEKLAAIFPSLERTLPSVTQGLADMAQSVTDVLTSPEGLERIENTISNIGDAISKAAPGIGDFVDGLLTLAEKFSEKMPDLSEWFNGAGKSFSDWIDDITRKDWFTGKSPLDTAFEGLGGTLKTVLDTLGALAKEGFEFMKDPQKIEDFKSALRDIGTLLQNIVNLSNQINDGNLFKNMVPTEAPWNEDWPGLKPGSAPDQAINGENFLSEEPKFDHWTNLFNTFKQSVLLGFANISETAAMTWANISARAAELPGQLSSAWSTLGSIASTAWSVVKTSVESALSEARGAVLAKGGEIIAEVGTWPGRIVAALGNLGGLLLNAGKEIIGGLLRGIQEKVQEVYNFVSGIAARIAELKGPLSYDRTVLTPNGQALMQGLQDGIEGGLQGVLDRARAIAGEISAAINEGTAGVDLATMPDQLKRSLDELELQRKELKVQYDGIPKEDKAGREALRGQMDQIQALKHQLSLQREQLGFSQKYGDSVQENNDFLGQQLGKTVDIASNFAMANANQLMSDLGISGKGFLDAGSQLADWGMQQASQFIFNVSSADEAIAIKNNQMAKQALQFTRR